MKQAIKFDFYLSATEKLDLDRVARVNIAIKNPIGSDDKPVKKPRLFYAYAGDSQHLLGVCGFS